MSGILDEGGQALLDEAAQVLDDGTVQQLLDEGGGVLADEQGNGLDDQSFTSPFVPLLLLPPLSAWGAPLPFAVMPQTSPGPAVRIFLPAAWSAGTLLPAVVARPAGTQLPPAPGFALLLPVRVDVALPPPRLPLVPAWQKDHEGWAVARERLSHVQALWQYGELACFALAWHIEDFMAGFVQRCWRCWQGDPDDAQQGAESAIAAAYGQGNQYLCPVCYNTTFALPEGASPVPGLRALIVRPAVWSEFDRAQQYQARGVFDSAALNVESVPDFRVRSGDWAFRADGTRWFLRVPRRVTLRTGFGEPWQRDAAITYNLMQAGLESGQSASYLIPPSPQQLARVLGTYTRVPADYSWAETVNAPLIPLEAPPPASSGAPQGSVTFPLSGFPSLSIFIGKEGLS